MRYYYSDPLAAAWMSDKFLMRFEWDCRTLGKQSQGSAYEVPFCYDVISVDRMNSRPEKYYIHPDSLHLLEPQAGDVATDTSNPALEVIEIDKGQYGGACQYSGKIELKNAKHRKEIGLLKIIQRNGKAFMWPEVEA